MTGVSVGRGEPRSNGSPRIMVAELDPVDPDPTAAARRARELLELLVDLYDRGMREPLPLYCQTSAAWATAATAGEDPVAAATGKWKTALRGQGRGRGSRPLQRGGRGSRRPVRIAIARGPGRRRVRRGVGGGRALAPRPPGPSVVGPSARTRACGDPMTVTSPAPFDVCGPLPGGGVTVLEASAGTGKTFTIARVGGPLRRRRRRAVRDPGRHLHPHGHR